MTTIQMPSHKTRHSLNAAMQIVGEIMSTPRLLARVRRGSGPKSASLVRASDYAEILIEEQQTAVLVGGAAASFLSSDERARRLAA
jgi:hypothetical protein